MSYKDKLQINVQYKDNESLIDPTKFISVMCCFITGKKIRFMAGKTTCVVTKLVTRPSPYIWQYCVDKGYKI